MWFTLLDGTRLFLGKSTTVICKYLNETKYFILTALMAINALMIGYSAALHSPTHDEPAHLVAGLSHWKYGHFDLYRVNPPLTRMIATIPLLVVGFEEDWSEFYEKPGGRPVFGMGANFIKANGKQSAWLLTISRWACIPISLLGCWYSFRFAAELYGTVGGLFAAALWCFSPNILAHAELVTPDCAAASFGIGATYYYWKWLKNPSWEKSLLAGLFLGLAELSKTTWVILFLIWPVLWGFWELTPEKDRNKSGYKIRPSLRFLQLITILLSALYILNLGYLFEGSFKKLGEYEFVSATLTGLDEPGEVGNRFRNTCFHSVRIPFPSNYVQGIDTQKKDFEEWDKPNYLGQEWKQGGWWYYYLYALAVKVPLGIWIIFFVSIGIRFSKIDQLILWRDEVILLTPGICVLFLVSSQTEMNEHSRYVLPMIATALIFCSRCGVLWQEEYQINLLISGFRMAIVLSLIWVLGACLWIYPHQLSYFNELVGGPGNGHNHLLGSNSNWGQDVYFVADWIDEHPEARPLTVANYGLYDPSVFGIVYPVTPAYDPESKLGVKYIGPQSGWHIVDIRHMKNPNRWYDYFQNVKPVDRVGYTFHIFHLSVKEANKLRAQLKLPPL